MDEQEAVRIAEELLQKAKIKRMLFVTPERALEIVDEINQRHDKTLCQRFQDADILLINLISIIRAAYEKNNDKDDLALSEQLEAISELLTDQHECYHVIISALQRKIL